MKRIVLMSILSVLLLAAVGLTACGGNEPSTGQSVIHFDQETVDVGTVPPGVVLDYSFHFTNEGDAPLIVDANADVDVLEGCWPGKPKVVGLTTLQPGDESTVRVMTPTVQEMKVSGPHLFMITVKSNDPVEPEKILYISAYFEPAGSEPSTGQPVIHFDQETVDVGTVPPGVALDYSFHFTNEGDAPLIVDAETDIDVLEGCWPGKPKVVGLTTLQPGDESTVRVTAPTVQEMKVPGPHLFMITVKSNDPVEPEKILYISAYFEPAE